MYGKTSLRRLLQAAKDMKDVSSCSPVAVDNLLSVSTKVKIASEVFYKYFFKKRTGETAIQLEVK